MSEDTPQERPMYRPRVASYWIILLEAAVLRSLRKSLKPFDISEVQFIILDACFRGEANSAASIARLTHYDPAVISRQVDSLYNKGLLTRKRLEEDRRVVRLSLTEEARVLMKKLLLAAMEADERVTRHLDSDEHDILRRVVRKLVLTLERRAE